MTTTTNTPIVLLDADLQKNAAEWHSIKSQDVNDPPSDFFEAQQTEDGTMTVINTYAGTKKYAGALVSNKRTLPRYNGALLPYVSMHVRFKWPYAIYRNVARHELDLKVCTKTRPNPQTAIRNVANFSTQWNADTGQFQIDQDPPGWTDTGFVVEEIAPDVWHDLTYRFWYDPVALLFSVLSITFDECFYEISGNLRNVAFQETNWEEIAAVQIQNEMFNPGCTVIQYANVKLAWSGQPL